MKLSESFLAAKDHKEPDATVLGTNAPDKEAPRFNRSLKLLQDREPLHECLDLPLFLTFLDNPRLW